MDMSRNLVPQNIEDLKAYVPGKTIEEVVAAYKPERISKLASNENRWGSSPAVNNAVLTALAATNNYPDPIARKLSAALGDRLGISADEIMIASGSESLLGGLFRTFFNAGENVVTVDATFVGAYIQAQIHNVEVKRVPLTSEYQFDVEALASAIDECTKMLYIANPNNPTGTYIPREEFEWLMKQVPENVLVVMDEAYYEFARSLPDYPDVLSYNYKNVIVLRTFSKGYGLAGFRVGYAIASEEKIKYLRKTRLTFEPGVVAQAAALAALNDDEFLNETTILAQRAKEDLYQFFQEMETRFAHSAANFIMIKLYNENTARVVTQQCLEQGVILRHIAGFGLPDCIRVTVGVPEEMEHFKRVFRDCCSRL